MLAGSLYPEQSVAAGRFLQRTAAGQETGEGEPSTENSSTEGTTTEEISSEETTTEETSSEEIITEDTTTEEVTTEQQPPEIDETIYLKSELSPATSKVIVIDPGHCKKHSGASGHGLKEENVVYDIASACRTKLNKYGDVTVYMTRDKSSCCSELGLGGCLIARNNYAKMLDADFLVSMHINAGGSSGANVLAAYKSGYHDSIRKKTQKFGKEVLKKLKKLGIANRGLLLRKSGTGNRYSNGKLADYYSIVRNGVIQNIPSVIIEHGYVTSSSDCSKFFKTSAKRKKVGQADADAIISYYNLKKSVISGKFKKQDGESYYIAKDGRKVVGWVKDGGAWYYFDEQGKMVTGFLNQGEDTFYLHPVSGKLIIGSFKVGKASYLAMGNGVLVKNQVYSDGIHRYLFKGDAQQAKKGLRTVDGATYYINKKGYVTTGIQKVSGKYYLFDSDSGKMLYGYQKYKGKYYYFNSQTGVMSRNKIVTVGKKRYYFASNGVRKTGFIKYKGSKYYFNPKNGSMVKGWKKIGKKYYYFDKTTGKMQKNKWIGKYYVNSKGIRTKKR